MKFKTNNDNEFNNFKNNFLLHFFLLKNIFVIYKKINETFYLNVNYHKKKKMTIIKSCQFLEMYLNCILSMISNHISSGIFPISDIQLITFCEFTSENTNFIYMKK